MATQNPNTNVMYVDYKFWYDTKTKVVTLDEEMNLNIPNGEMFEFRNNQFFPMDMFYPCLLYTSPSPRDS